jgi:hypothetical protein
VNVRRARLAWPARSLLALVLTAAALSGCGGARLVPDTPPGVNLAGSWVLDAQASQNPQAMIDEIQKAMMKRMRRAGPMDSMDSTDAPDESDDTGGADPRGPAPAAGRRHAGAPPGAGASGPRRVFQYRSPYEIALGAQLHVDRLTIEQSPTRLVFSRGDWRRSFTPGGQSVVSVAEGVADQRSGWSGRDYVIELKPQVGPRILERYGLSADNRQLVEHFTLSDEGLPKLEFTRVYVRGTPPPRALPTSN